MRSDGDVKRDVEDEIRSDADAESTDIAALARPRSMRGSKMHQCFARSPNCSWAQGNEPPQWGANQ